MVFTTFLPSQSICSWKYSNKFAREAYSNRNPEVSMVGWNKEENPKNGVLHLILDSESL